MGTIVTRHGGPGSGHGTPEPRFHHAAVFYGDGDELLAGLVPPVRRALADDQAVLVALTARNTVRLRGELGDEADRVRFLEMEKVGVNPARIIPVWREFVEENVAPGRPALGIGEPIWADRTPDELIECHHHEALLNLAFHADPAWSLLCPYDTASLDDAVLERARTSHSVLSEGESEWESEHYISDTNGDPFHGPLSEAPADAEVVEFGADGIAFVRERVRAHAAAARLDERRTADLVLAVDELSANSVRHGGGGGVFRAWERDGRLFCEIRDAVRIEGPLVGRIRPGIDWVGGRGLWLANQLCDLLQIRALPEGNLARVQMRTAP